MRFLKILFSVGEKKSQHLNSIILKIITRQVKHSMILLCEPLTSNFKKGKKGKEKKFTKKSSKINVQSFFIDEVLKT